MLKACLNPSLKSGFVRLMLGWKLEICFGHDVTEDH